MTQTASATATGNSQPATAQRDPGLNPMVSFKRELATIAQELPTSKDIPVEKMKSAITVAVQKTPDLLRADRSTLWQSARQCAADGLLPDGREAAFVTFRTRINGTYVDAVKYIPMVYGLRKRAMNSGAVRDIDAYIVYQGEWEAERFVLRAGDNPGIEHQPIIDGAPGEPELGAPIGAYAIATFRNGDKVREWMSAADIEKVRRSAASQQIYEKGKKPRVSEERIGVWLNWWEEQWKKTVVRRLSKKLPLSSEDMSVIQESDRDHDFKDVTPAREAPKGLAARALEARQKAQATGPTPDAPEPADDKAEPETIEGEVVEADINQDADTAPADALSAFPGSDEWSEGMKAFAAGEEETALPYPQNSQAGVDWFGGYHSAKKAAE